MSHLEDLKLLNVSDRRARIRLIAEDRIREHGDFSLNMVALTRQIEQMFTQVTQREITLPDNFDGNIFTSKHHRPLQDFTLYRLFRYFKN